MTLLVILRIAPPAHGESFTGTGRSRLNLLGFLYPQERGTEGLAQTDRARMGRTIPESGLKVRIVLPRAEQHADRRQVAGQKHFRSGVGTGHTLVRNPVANHG